MLLSALCLLALAAQPPVASGPESPVLRPPTAPYGLLEVSSGHVTIATPAGLETLFGAGEQRLLPEMGHLEFGALSEAELGWIGKGSLRVQGPASLEWSGIPFGGETLGVLEFARAELEVRVGKIGLRLPGGVLLVAEHGAFELLKRSTGIYGVHNLGGRTATLFVPAEGGPARLEVASGSWAWIDPADYLGHPGFEALFSPQAEEETQPAPDEHEPVAESPEEPVFDEQPSEAPVAVAPRAHVLMGAPAFAPWEAPALEPAQPAAEEPVAPETVELEPVVADLVFGEFSGPRGLIAPVGASMAELGSNPAAPGKVEPLLELPGPGGDSLEPAPLGPRWVSIPFGRSPGARLVQRAAPKGTKEKAERIKRLALPTSGVLSDLLNGGIDLE